MPQRPILVYPDPRLKQVCAPVERFDEALQQLAADLRETLLSVPGTGLAAPQIGVLLRLIYIDSSRSPKYAESSSGPLWLVNPQIVERSGAKRFREGCLSLPQFTANVKRARRIVVTAQDCTGAPLRLDVEGFEAVLLQHEIDHLDGVLFIDRVEDLGSTRLREPASDD
ncbi:MAG: peptide deformylase [Fimbriimonadaceae bacterium]|nr:peptide deformylase [Fimbriimonadaceae bacterium]